MAEVVRASEPVRCDRCRRRAPVLRRVRNEGDATGPATALVCETCYKLATVPVPRDRTRA